MRISLSRRIPPSDAALLAELPPSVDPCGERGEFHTFCFAGPMFDREIPVATGDMVVRDGFCFIDVQRCTDYKPSHQ